MAKKAKSKKSSGRDSIIVASKVKAFIKSKKCLTASETLNALNNKIYNLLEEAVKRTQGNRRSTVKPQDL